MTDRLRFRAVWLMLPLVAASCGTTREGLVLDTRLVSAEELIPRVREESERIRTLSGGGTLVFDSQRISGTAEFSLALRKPDSLLIRLEGPFGMDVGLLFMDAERYVAYNSMENEVMLGSSDSTAFLAFVPVPLSARQIVDAFSGRYPIDPDARLLQYAVDEDRFLVTALCGTDTCRYWVDPEAVAVTSYRRTAPDGRVLLDGDLTRLTTVDGITLPKSIVLRAPARGSTVRILFADLEVNGDAPDFSYTIPASARRRTRPVP